MENSDVLRTESFSYSWLTDKKSPFFDIPLDNFRPKTSNRNDQDFIFDIPTTKSPCTLVYADEIFSNGYIMPIYVDRSKVEASRTSTCYSSKTQFLEKKTQSKWRKSSKRILPKCFGFVKPLRKTACSGRVDDLDRKVCEVESFSNSLEASPRPSAAYSVVEWSYIKKIRDIVDLYYGLKKGKILNNSQVSRPISSCNSTNLCFDVESSMVHEAILYCKRSIEK